MNGLCLAICAPGAAALQENYIDPATGGNTAAVQRFLKNTGDVGGALFDSRRGRCDGSSKDGFFGKNLYMIQSLCR